MIYDKIENFSKYEGALDNFSVAGKLLREICESKNPIGKYEAVKDEVFANVCLNDTFSQSTAKGENHRKFIDIQFVLSGEEKVVTQEYEKSVRLTDYDDRDLEFFSLSSVTQDFVLRPGYFLMLFPGEVHAPGISTGKAKQTTKAVIKIKL